MPLRSDWSASYCPIARTLDVMGDPWIVLILREAFTGSRRFEQFRDNLGVAHNVLSTRLRSMVEAGLLRREPYRAQQRTHHEYLLTEAGADLLPVLHALARWGHEHTPAPDPDHDMAIQHRACGRPVTSADWCAHCRLPLTPDEVTWLRTWHTSQHTNLTGARPTA